MVFNWLQAIIVAAFVGSLSLAAHKVDMFFVDKRHAAELTAQKSSLEARCEAEKKITEETANELQSKISSLNARLALIKRVRPATCVSILADPAREHDAKTHDAGLPRQNASPLALSSDALFDFAADAEITGLRLDACQAFINKTWALANGKRSR